jgi:hypothetical protein
MRRQLLLLSGLLLVLSASYVFAEPASAPDVSGTKATSSGSSRSESWPFKDFPAFVVSIFALLVSGGTLWYTIKSKGRETERSARSDFAEIVESLIDLREKRDTLQRELGSDWGKSKTFETRAALGDKQRSLVARAGSLLDNYHIDASDIEYIIIAASLTDDGRYGESLRYYEKAMDVSPSDLARALARRPYGSALIMAGHVERGRAELLRAACEFKNLSTAEAGLDTDRMQYLRAHVFRTLIWAQIRVGSKTELREGYNQGDLQDDFRELVASTAAIKHHYNWNDLGVDRRTEGERGTEGAVTRYRGAEIKRCLRLTDFGSLFF